MNMRLKVQAVALVWAGLITLLGLFATATLAEDGSEAIRLRAQRTHQRATEAVAEFTRGLELTENQARQMLTLLDRAARLHIEVYERQARFLPEMIKVFGAFAREGSLNQGFSPEVERSTARLHHQAKEAREAFIEQMVELEEEAAAILSERQAAYARSFKPGKAAQQRKAKERMGTNRQAAFRRGRDRGANKRHAGENEPLAAARQELAALHQQIHPRLSPVGRYLLHPTAAEPLCQITGGRPNQGLRDALEAFERGTKSYPTSACERDRARVAALRVEINNWNLINGLHLGLDQIERIVVLYDAAQAEIESAKAKSAKRGGRRNRVHPREIVVSLERAVEEVMNPGQRQVLAEYKACLLPPKDLKNPVRAGQANDSGRLEKWLTRARRMPFGRLRRMVGRLLDKEAQHLGELSPDERQERASLLLATVREAAGMSDVDFELSKAELAERIAPRDRPQDLKDKIGGLARQEGLPGRITQFMLKPEFIEQLRQRGRQLAEGVETKSADLANGPQAGDG